MDSVSDVEDMVQQKAKELFAVCDKEGKGFINKVDMQVNSIHESTHFMITINCPQTT